MPLLVVGSVALDCVETPTDKRDDVLGGSAVFFSYAASFFSPVKMIGTVGEDWPQEHTKFLEKRGIDTSGIEVIKGGKTFRWRGRYLPNMNDRETLEVHLNVFGDFKPKLQTNHRDSKFVFLGNASPVTQLSVLDQVPDAKLTVADTMDLWINIQRDELEALLKRIDGLVLNDSEAKLLAEDENLVRAGPKVRAMGPKFVVIKKGEHGAMFFSEHEMYVLPAYPTPQVLDPTGAGDSFAGGMMGYLASKDRYDPQSLKEALAYGVVTASYTVEDFSLDRLAGIDRADLDRRVAEYRQMLTF
jgi:sugar/nucleoside kinase (ribokinase family)